ncbi:Lateral signaling target protein 2-like protein [Phytophthora ramorum]|uniref:FYVE-type domain-containing protein n=1 Tax=Phytophthora ramorum TaxID=164328 RepID=H3GJA3_PHYRM|nr:Lateral signaling target protein 2-like protein [Phytophthora ramorum]
MTDYSSSTGSPLTGTPLTPRSLSSFGSSNGSDDSDADESSEMCVKERERLTTVAKRMTESLLEATDLLGGIPWSLVHEKHGISLFRADATNAATNVPCNVHAVCKFACDIEDVAASLITPTTASFKRMMAMLSSDFLDGAVVQNIVEPTAANPHRYVALKWAAFKSSGPFAKDRDLLMLEYVDMIEDAQGQMIAFRIMESVDTPAGFSKYAESPKYTRDLVPLMGFMYHSTKRSGELRMTYTCTFDKNGDLPAWVANSAIQSHVEKCINGILKYTESFRVGREEIVLPQQVIPMSELDHCRICSKKFCVRRRRYNCLKCGEVCCSSCSSVRSAHVPEIGERQLRVCTACVIEARRSSRNTASGMEPPSTPSFSSTTGSNQFFADTNESTRVLGRAQSFSVASGEPKQQPPKRRSYDNLLDPVRSRLIEYKTFSSGNDEGHSTTGSAIGVPKASFPSRSFSDGLVMRNKALFAAKRRGSPADLAISLEAFRLHQMRMGNAERQPEDGSDDNDNTDDESSTSSSSTSPTYSIVRPLPVEGRSRIQLACENNQELSTEDDSDKFEFNEAMARANNIIVAANYANSLAQQARSLSHFRVVALQQEHVFMAPMLRNGGVNTSSSSNRNGPIVRRRPRHRRHGSDLEAAGAVLYSN